MREIFTAGYRKEMAVGKWENEARLTCSTQPFSRDNFVAISSVELCGRNFQHVFFSLELLWRSVTYLQFFINSILHNLISIAVPCKQFHKLLQPPLELRNLHTLGTKTARILSLIQPLIWRSRLWKSDSDSLSWSKSRSNRFTN